MGISCDSGQVKVDVASGIGKCLAVCSSLSLTDCACLFSGGNATLVNAKPISDPNFFGAQISAGSVFIASLVLAAAARKGRRKNTKR